MAKSTCCSSEPSVMPTPRDLMPLLASTAAALKHLYTHRQNTHIHKIDLEMVMGFEFSFVTPSVRKEAIHRSGVTRRTYKNDWQVAMEVGEQIPP